MTSLIKANLALEGVHVGFAHRRLELTQNQQAVFDDHVELDLIRSPEDLSLIIELVDIDHLHPEALYQNGGQRIAESPFRLDTPA